MTSLQARLFLLRGRGSICASEREAGAGASTIWLHTGLCKARQSGMGTTVMIPGDALHSTAQDPVSQSSQRILTQLLFCSAFQLEIKKMKKRQLSRCLKQCSNN